ncbi:MAG TPA: penicillin acylase family protein, partial [Azospirillaceae bacterium]|nr:penicillin acylase family protein [Azospirillaceae bacterium]
ENPFAHSHGAGFRGVYDLDNLTNSRFIIATGQSGNPLSAHWGNLVQRWRDGGHVLLAGSAEDVAANGLGTLTLTPVPPK